MLKKIAEVSKVCLATSESEVYCVWPVLEKWETVRNLLNIGGPGGLSPTNLILYMYIWHPQEEKFLRGKASSFYHKWFILRKLDMNEIEHFDYLYTSDRKLEIKGDDSMGVIYISTKNE